MGSLQRWKSLHDEIENSSDVKYHHNRAKAAEVLGHPDEANHHREEYKKAFKNHPKYPDYQKASKEASK